jgi:hypothetical protein
MANQDSSEAISRRGLLKTSAAGLALTSGIGNAPRYISIAYAEGEVHMAKVKANGITINYEQQGAGELAHRQVSYVTPPPPRPSL